jgi:hypothetical protein
MKEVEAVLGIVLIIAGDIMFEMDWGDIIRFCGLALVICGIAMYLFVVESLDTKKKKGFKKKEPSHQILFVK